MIDLKSQGDDIHKQIYSYSAHGAKVQTTASQYLSSNLSELVMGKDEWIYKKNTNILSLLSVTTKNVIIMELHLSIRNVGL